MATAEAIRQSHFRRFARLSPGERLMWSLGTGWLLWRLMPESSRRYAEGLRNGWKKRLAGTRTQKEFEDFIKQRRTIAKHVK